MQKIIYLDKNDSGEMPAHASEKERLDTAVRWINRKVESTVHFGLLQIGYYLLNNFFDGDIKLALSKNPHKETSFRQLCQRPDLVISSTHLVNSVKLVVQEKQLGRDPMFQGLPVSHKIALLSVGDHGQKRLLARRAVEERLSVRALTQQVRQLRGDAEDGADVWSRRMRRAVQQLARLAEAPILEGLTRREAEALDHAIVDTRRRLQTALAEIRGIRSVAV